ncbi:cysteate racemase [Planococcus lenghuensis]|uniref:Aspartate racemase n=1 Tax=Planococcus lenghuensis TaxID=2213202 RepID=A0A1Q2KXC5_9BACL|nr:amino acid racemase [Planococcus lenghuensis]AQQ52467.1 aspartate racemase [Planococcus lenghuensis]
MKKTLGIIGGVGPLATMYLGESVVRRTLASKDQEHIPMLISNNPHIPDRTAYILGESAENPVPVMIRDALKLVGMGAEVLAMPCNTAHSFYEQLQEALPVPLLHMVNETANEAKREGATRTGILATDGTLKTRVYQKACAEAGLMPIVPRADIQELVMSVIYKNVKAGEPVNAENWQKIDAYMRGAGCEKVLLGCTELSIVYKELALSDRYIDSSVVLAERAIEACGYEVKNKRLSLDY